MWFEDEVISGRRLGSVKRHRGTAVTMNLRAAKAGKAGKGAGDGTDPVARRPMGLLAAALLVPLVLAGVSGLVWYGVRAVTGSLFQRNVRFTITRLQIRGDSPIVGDFIREQKGIREGTNLFAFDADALRREFLERAPSYRTMRITRLLPDILNIEVTPRVPSARLVLGWRDTLVADRDGAVFATVGYTGHLPAITGCRDRSLAPGSTVRGSTVAAVQMVDVCDNPQLGIKVQEVGLSSDDHLTLVAQYGGCVRRIQLSWDGMGSRSPESRLNLLRKLGRWVQVMQTPQGMDHVEFDGTYPDRIYAL
jgi:hypothetical protein